MISLNYYFFVPSHTRASRLIYAIGDVSRIGSYTCESPSLRHRDPRARRIRAIITDGDHHRRVVVVVAAVESLVTSHEVTHRATALAIVTANTKMRCRTAKLLAFSPSSSDILSTNPSPLSMSLRDICLLSGASLIYVKERNRAYGEEGV